MAQETDEEALEAVLAEARRRIRADRERAPDAWRAALLDVEIGIFHRGFSLVAIRRAHDLIDPGHSTAFQTAFGCRPGEYVRRCRFDAAQQMLDLEPPPLRWQIARKVGLAARDSLQKRRAREHSSNHEARRDEPPKSRRRDDETASRALWSLALEPETAAAEIAALRPPSKPARPTDLKSLEQRWAAEWWSVLRELPRAERRRKVLAGIWLETPAAHAP